MPRNMAALQKLSLHCKFGEYLNTELRNQFVFGLKNQRIQTRLLETRNLTRDFALKTACAMDLTEIGINQFKVEAAAAVNFVGAGAKAKKNGGPGERRETRPSRTTRGGKKKGFPPSNSR